MSEKEIRADAKLKNLAKEALEDLWRFRNPEEGGEKLTLEEIAAVQIPRLYGFAVSLSSLSEFYKWLRLKRRVESAQERAAQARLELARDPNITPDDLTRIGQMVFTAETIEDGNIKAYVELVKLQLQDARHQIEIRKLKMLEAKAQRLEAAEDAIRKINSDGSLSADAQRAAVLEKMDEFFGLKKKN